MKQCEIMTKLFVFRSVGWLFLLVFLLCLPRAVPALEVPAPEGYVNDHAKLLTPQQKAGLESLLRRFEAETTNQVVVLIVPSLEGDSLEDFSRPYISFLRNLTTNFCFAILGIPYKIRNSNTLTGTD